MLDEQLQVPRRFERSGFRHKLVVRDDLHPLAIFRRDRLLAEGIQKPHYETVVIHVTDEEQVLPSGAIIPKGKEMYPSTSDWGMRGWTYPNLREAKEKFRELQESHANQRPV